MITVTSLTIGRGTSAAPGGEFTYAFKNTAGFLAMYMMGKSIEECVRCGIAVSAEIVKKSGCTLPDRNDTQTIEYL